MGTNWVNMASFLETLCTPKNVTKVTKEHVAWERHIVAQSFSENDKLQLSPDNRLASSLRSLEAITGADRNISGGDLGDVHACASYKKYL